MLYVARFRGAAGRYLVNHECHDRENHEPGRLCLLGGQRIHDKRQAKYGNKPDPETGYYLNEMYRTFSGGEIIEIKRVK